MRGSTAINLSMLDIFRLRMFSERVRRPEQAVRRLTEGPRRPAAANTAFEGRGADAGRLDGQRGEVHIGLHSAARRRETLFGVVRQGGIPSRTALRRVRYRPGHRREQGAQVGLDRLRLAPELQRGRAARDVDAQQVRSGSFAAMLQNGSVMMPGVISPAPSPSKSTRPSPRSRTKRSYRPRPSCYAAPCRNVSSRTHGTNCQPQCGHRGTSSLRTSNPAMPASMRSTWGPASKSSSQHGCLR